MGKGREDHLLMMLPVSSLLDENLLATSFILNSLTFLPSDEVPAL
jgi:hypothetical protein